MDHRAAISIHSLPKEGDLYSLLYLLLSQYFNPLPPQRGRQAVDDSCAVLLHFNPLPPQRGRRLFQNQTAHAAPHFNPLPPQRGRLHQHLLCIFGCDFNPLPPQRGRLFLSSFTFFSRLISIHSLPKEGDVFKSLARFRRRISIHSLPKEGDRRCCLQLHCILHFNPLPPQRGRLWLVQLVQDIL